MAGENKGTVVKKVMTEEEAKKELGAYIAEIAELMELVQGKECLSRIGELVWISKTGEKIRIKEMQTYHILAALRALTTKEVANVVSGRNPGFSTKAMIILALKLELARRYQSSVGVSHWERKDIERAIAELKLKKETE